MNENSSQTIKELSEDKEIENLSELDNDIPSADSSTSRVKILKMQDSHKKNLHHYWVNMTIT